MSEEKEIRALTVPATNGTGPGVPETITVYPSYAYPEAQPEEQGVPLTHYLYILKRRRWEILSFIVFAVVATVIVSSRLTPIYESEAVVEIDRQEPSGVVGREADRAIPLNDSDQFMATQIKLIQSDAVLRPVAERFKIAAADVGDRNGKVPAVQAAKAPVVLKRLSVKWPSNTYLLLINYRSADPNAAADIANAIAQSYIQNTYNIRFRATAGLSTFMEKQLEELKAKMELSSAALAQFEKELNVINPEEKTSILTSRLLQFNTEYTNAQAERVRKEVAYNALKSGSIDVAFASEQADQLRRMADRIDETREKFAVISSQYGSNHPEYKRTASQLNELDRQFAALKASITQRVATSYEQAANREKILKSALAETKAEFDSLNARSFEYKALKQEAEGDRGLYQELMRKIHESGINSTFQNSSIRLADVARPALNPIFPNIRMNALLALLLATLIGVGAAVLLDVMDDSVRDPEVIQRELKTEVLGSLPIVRSWRGRILPVSPNGHGSNGTGAALAKAGSYNGQTAAFEEAVRTLCESVLLSDLGHRPRSLLITSATPREGKTTTAVYLALANSQQKRKTLLIDADLRSPGVHARLGLHNQSGLRDVVTEGVDWHTLLQQNENHPDLDILVAGKASLHAAYLVGKAIEKIVADAVKGYDLVIIDSPPLLGFVEPLQMAAVADGVVVLTLAGQTNRNAVRNALASLKRLNANVVGLVLNEVRQDMSERYYYYGYYGKHYSKYYTPTNV
jgi:succinoglycan biosynthesis transport protein ExoP